MGFWPFADVKVDAWAVDVPPPMIKAPGLLLSPPFRKSRLSGNGSSGTASWFAHARDHPKVAVFTTVGEKICVSCPLSVWRPLACLWTIIGIVCGSARFPLSALKLVEKE